MNGVGKGIAFGCQAYTWQMTGRRVGEPDLILDTVLAAGFTGFELETCMLGGWYDDPARLSAALAQRGIELAALTLALPWAEAVETYAERTEADRLLRYMAHFPRAQLVLAQLPGLDRNDLRNRQRNALSCINAIGRRARDAGIPAGFHPNSPEGSVFRTPEDYETLIDGLDARVVGFVPDAGHMAKGGLDVREAFRIYRPLIRHVHFKDYAANGAWAAMGEGVIDYPGLVTDLHESGYDGWIIVEDESPLAETDPDAATLANGRYVSERLALRG